MHNVRSKKKYVHPGICMSLIIIMGMDALSC